MSLYEEIERELGDTQRAASEVAHRMDEITRTLNNIEKGLAEYNFHIPESFKFDSKKHLFQDCDKTEPLILIYGAKRKIMVEGNEFAEDKPLMEHEFKVRLAAIKMMPQFLAELRGWLKSLGVD